MDTQLVEKLYKDGNSLREIERLTGFNRKLVSTHLKSVGILVKKTISNKDVEKEKIYLEAESYYLKGESIKSIAKKMNFSTIYFSRWLESRGSKEAREVDPVIEDKINKAVALIESGISRTQAARLIGINDNLLVYHLNCRGIKTRNGFRTYDESVFEKIDTEEKAYWLGFLYADGSISNSDRHVLELALKKNDVEHIHLFRSFLNSDALISNKHIKLGNKKHQAVRISIYSKKIAEDLVQKGCTPRKSLTLTFPSIEIVPTHLQKHFIRGYFDGDGSITLRCKTANLSLTGTEKFLVDIAKIYDIPLNFKPAGKAKTLTFCKKVYTLKFLSDIYSDYTVALKRKEEKGLKFLELNKEHLKGFDGMPNEGKLSSSV